jgi:hypothetical protein
MARFSFSSRANAALAMSSATALPDRFETLPNKRSGAVGRSQISDVGSRSCVHARRFVAIVDDMTHHPAA